MRNDKSGFISDVSNTGLAGLSGTNPTLQKGDKGADVRSLQINLVKAGFKLPKYGTDGIFGSETAAAVINFQTANGLPGTGIVDAATWAKLQGGSGNIGQSIFDSVKEQFQPAIDILNFNASGYEGTATPPQEESGNDPATAKNNAVWWIGGGAVAVSLLGVALAAGGDK